MQLQRPTRRWLRAHTAQLQRQHSRSQDMPQSRGEYLTRHLRRTLCALLPTQTSHPARSSRRSSSRRLRVRPNDEPFFLYINDIFFFLFSSFLFCCFVYKRVDRLAERIVIVGELLEVGDSRRCLPNASPSSPKKIPTKIPTKIPMKSYKRITASFVYPIIFYFPFKTTARVPTPWSSYGRSSSNVPKRPDRRLLTILMILQLRTRIRRPLSWTWHRSGGRIRGKRSVKGHEYMGA